MPHYIEDGDNVVCQSWPCCAR